MSDPTYSYLKPMMLVFAGFTAMTIGDAAIRYANDLPVFVIAFVSCGVTAFWMLALSPCLGGIRATFTLPRLKLRLFRGLVISAMSFVPLLRLCIWT